MKIFKIISKHDTNRLDKVLVTHKAILSREAAKKIIAQGLVFVNHSNKGITPHTKVCVRDEISFSLPPQEAVQLEPVDFPLEIHYEDEYLLIVYKPAGIVVHPATSYPGVTLLHYLLAHTSLSNIGYPDRIGIVHRIDKETSGLLIICKDNKTHLELAQQFHQHTIKRVYHAIVWGINYNNNGTIDSPIGRHPIHRKKFYTTTNGKRAITHWKLLEKKGAMNYLECTLETGRTHQIRVHLASLQLYIIGDKVYKSTKPSNMPSFAKNFPRQALHATSLGFLHPIKKKHYNFHRPLPKDMQELVACFNTQSIEIF